MPRPKLGRERINITLPPDIITKLDVMAVKEGSTRSDLIEEAIKALLARRKAKK